MGCRDGAHEKCHEKGRLFHLALFDVAFGLQSLEGRLFYRLEPTGTLFHSANRPKTARVSIRFLFVPSLSRSPIALQPQLAFTLSCVQEESQRGQDAKFGAEALGLCVHSPLFLDRHQR